MFLKSIGRDVLLDLELGLGLGGFVRNLGGKQGFPLLRIGGFQIWDRIGQVMKPNARFDRNPWSGNAILRILRLHLYI